jgi:hypothetical protein
VDAEYQVLAHKTANGLNFPGKRIATKGLEGQKGRKGRINTVPALLVVSGGHSAWLRRKSRWVSVLAFWAGRETRPAATGTVALPRIRDDLRPFAVAIGLPRNFLTLNAIHTLL